MMRQKDPGEKKRALPGSYKQPGFSSGCGVHNATAQTETSGTSVGSAIVGVSVSE